MMHRVYLALGSNLGDREQNLSRAVGMISRLPRTGVLRCSSLYETEPVGYADQDRFLNMAAAVETELEPLELLASLQGIERDLLRTREIHWGPRTIDIDILLFDDIQMDLPQLSIPHPRMFERAFVLVPLREILDGMLPEQRNWDDLLKSCGDRGGIRRVTGIAE